MSEKTELIVEHYNRTADLTSRFWQQRNATFLVLVAVVGIAALLTSPDSMNLFSAALSALLHLERAEREAIHTGLPYTVIHVGLMVTVFYLLVTLYHRHASIVRNFVYLGLLEQEIRRDLNIGERDIAFSRESSFYFENQSLILRIMKLLYTLILGGLLAAYFFLRLASDLDGGNVVLLFVDALAAAASGIVFLGYALLTKPKRARPRS